MTDWFDGLNTFMRFICHKSWLGGWFMPQKKSYFALQLPKGWWVFGLDLALHCDIDVYQFKFFAELVKEQVIYYILFLSVLRYIPHTSSLNRFRSPMIYRFYHATQPPHLPPFSPADIQINLNSFNVVVLVVLCVLGGGGGRQSHLAFPFPEGK